jgi:hypothetical protein
MSDARVRPSDRSAWVCASPRTHGPHFVHDEGHEWTGQNCPGRTELSGTALTIGEVEDDIASAWEDIDLRYGQVANTVLRSYREALGLDPATPLDGPLVVLHPGDLVVRLAPGQFRTPPPNGYVVVTSNPHEGRPKITLPSKAAVDARLPATNPQERTR